uniref:DNA damage induced apoptosis suppressor n=1 Tax=Oryctolagus cuniculus TaxID=9986 RepID=U3KN96_RABIT
MSKVLLSDNPGLQKSLMFPGKRALFGPLKSSCPKCGSTDEAENASYRYKLSLKVAESNKLFVITVFGSCLDTFFGLTATGLHRYIQDPCKILDILDSDTTQSLLTKAVETCFVGQSFIFGVTNFETQRGQSSDSSNFLQQCYDHKREVKALVACQIILPDPSVAGFTVIDYFHQLLQTANFRKPHCASQSPNSHLLTSDHSNSDLSSTYGSDSTSYFFESCYREKVSRFWQPSLELTSIGSQHTDNDDFSALEQNKVIGTFHQNRKYFSFAEATDSNSCHDPIQGSWSLVSYMDKNSTAEKLDVEIGLQTNQLSTLPSSYHDVGLTDSNLFLLSKREPLDSNNTKSFHNVMEIKNRYTQCELPCNQHQDADSPTHLQEKSLYYSPSPLKLEEITSGSQDCDSKIWDDLPFSESLNKFLAVVESEIAVTQRDASHRKHDAGNSSEFHADHSRLSTMPPSAEALHTPPVALRSSQATVATDSSKDNFLSNCETNSSSSVQKESQPDSTTSLGRNISQFFLHNTILSAAFPSSKDSETTLKTIRDVPCGDESLCRPITSESDHSCLSIKYFNECGGKSFSEMNEKLTALCSRKYDDVSDLCKLKKQSYRWPKNKGDGFTICRKLTYSLEISCSSPNTSINTLKDIPYGHINDKLTQSCSAGLEGSYNASADLFDDVCKETGVATEITKKSQNILLHLGTSLAESHHAEADFSLKSLSENSSQPSQKLSMQNISACTHPRACSPPPLFQSDSEDDFEDSQDFVPCSQSTPVAGFQKTRIYGINKLFQKITAYSDVDANNRKTRISPKNDKLGATPNCPENIKTPNQIPRSPIITSILQPEVFKHSHIAEGLETDSDDWVPPTTKKVFVSDMLGFQVMSLRKCFAAHNSPDQKELPRKKPKHAKQRTDDCLIKKKFNLKNTLTAIVTKQKTPKCSCKSSAWISRESNLGLDSFSEVKHYFAFSENCPSAAPETKSAWSPELFS